MRTKGDFGGISYTTGDFHTPGTSGLGKMSQADFGSLGFSLNDVFSTVFGKDAEAVKSTLQTGATTLVMNQAGSTFAQNPEAKQTLMDTTKEMVAGVVKEYKWIIYPVVGAAALVTLYGAYSIFFKKK